MKNYIIVSVVSLLIGAGIVNYAFPPKVETIVQEVTKEVEVVKRDIVVVTEKITQKDGTIVEKTRTEDKSIDTTKKDSQASSRTTVTNEKQYRVSVRAGTKTLNSNPEIIYSLGIEKKLIGPLNVGVHGSTDKQYGLSLSYDF